MTNDRYAKAVVGVVVCMWVAARAVALLDPSGHPFDAGLDVLISGIIGAAGGYIFTRGRGTGGS